METKTNEKLRMAVLILMIAGGAGFAIALSLWSTSHGIGISPDSIIYISVARSLLAGQGFQTMGGPLTQFPPAYPLFLASSAIAGVDPFRGARWLQALLFGMNVALIGICVYYFSRSILFSAIAILLSISSGSMLQIHAMAWSEPLFIFFALAAFLLLMLYQARQNIYLLIGAALMLGLALATRYIGVALLPAMLATVFLLGPQSLGRRIRDCLVLAVIGCLPLALWVWSSNSTSQTAYYRTVNFHPINAAQIDQFVQTLQRFWLPFQADAAFTTLLILLAGGLAICAVLLTMKDYVWRKRQADVSAAAQLCLFLFVAVYLAFLLYSISFVAANTPLDERILSPLFLFGSLLAISIAERATRLKYGPVLRWGLAGLFLLVVMGNSITLARTAGDFHKNGAGILNRVRMDPETTQYINALPRERVIYSNGPDLITFLTGRPAVMLPRKISAASTLPNPDFGRELESLQTDLAQNKAVVIYLDRVTWRAYLPSRDELENSYHLPVLRLLQDGVVYGTK